MCDAVPHRGVRPGSAAGEAVAETGERVADRLLLLVMLRGNALWLGALICAGLSGSAIAQPSDADKQAAANLAREGEAAGNEHKFQVALEKFKRAAQLDPSTPAYLCNVGLAHYALDSLPRAQLYLNRCYRANHDAWPAGIEEVNGYVVDALAKRDYAPVDVVGKPAGAKIHITYFDDEGDILAPTRVYLPFGFYQIEVSAPGYDDKVGQIEIQDRGARRHEYILSAKAVATTGGNDTTVRVGPDIPVTGGAPMVTKRHGDDGKRRWGWIATGSGVALLAGGTLAYLAARGVLDDVNAANDRGELYDSEGGLTDLGDELVGKLHAREYSAYGLWGTGAAAVGLGVYLLVTASEGDEQPLVTASAGADGGMVWMTWRR
jgi:tetratricopeptide (TPR) repeat protein